MSKNNHRNSSGQSGGQSGGDDDRSYGITIHQEMSAYGTAWVVTVQPEHDHVFNRAERHVFSTMEQAVKAAAKLRLARMLGESHG